MNIHPTPALRRLAALTAAFFSWSFIFAAAVQAATYKAPQAPGYRRLLTDNEMTRIVGATPVPIGGDGGNGNYGSGGGNAGVAAGAARPWEGHLGDVNTGNGNKMTQFPLVGWVARGGLSVSYTLTHNSENTLISGNPVGAKVLSNYDIALTYPNNDPNKINILWGDGSAETFTWNGSAFAPPPGIHDHLVVNVNGNNTATSYDLMTKDQLRFHIMPFTYNSNSYIAATSISDENGNTITINRYVNGALNTIVDPTGRKITLGYSGGYRSSITDPLGRVWTFGYDGSGNLTQINYPALNGTTYYIQAGYDGANNITSLRDRRGSTSTYACNIDGSLAWEQDAAGNRTSFGYSGSTTTITDPNGHQIVHTYNAAGQLASVTDALNYTEYYTYDSDNNVTQKEDRRGYDWNNTYDGMGNVLTAKDPYSNTTTCTYNGHNRPLTVVLPLGRSVAATYDANDNLTQVQEKDSSGTVKATTTYAVSSATYGLVTSKTDTNNHTTQYGYDANGYLNSVTTPLGHQTQGVFDALGFQTSRTDAMGRTTTYTPDAWERSVTTTYPDSTTNTYAYDPNGNLTAFTNYSAAWTRAYDADNRETGEYIGGGRIVAHSYDAAGQKGLLSTTTDTDGRVLSYAYSARNELSTVSETAGSTSYTYDANGNQTHAYLPNGIRTDQYYNNDNTLDSYYNTDSSGVIYQSYGYGYNADTQITGFSEGTSNNVHVTANPTNTLYGYDGQGHLTSENRTGTSPNSQSYTYDGTGNRTNVNSSNPFTYDSDDELKTVAGYNAFALTYNANGDRTAETINGLATTFTYDFDDRVTGITAGSTTITYRYDGLGRQVSRTVNGATTGYWPNGDQSLVEKGPGGTVDYTWGNGLIRVNGEYPLTDGRGNVRLTLNGSRSLTSSNVPDAFGVGSFTSGTASPYQWNGSAGYRTEGLAASGLSVAYSFQKVGDRYYDPALGCFLTRDTDLGETPYTYCDGDPVNCNDPSGHTTKTNQAQAVAIAIEIAMLAMGGLAAAAAGAAGELVQQTINSSGPIGLAGMFGITSNQQGNKDTTTVSVSVTGGRTTMTGSATNTQKPGSNVTTGSLGLSYQPDPNDSFSISHNSGGGGQEPSWTETYVHKFNIR